MYVVKKRRKIEEGEMKESSMLQESNGRFKFKVYKEKYLHLAEKNLTLCIIERVGESEPEFCASVSNPDLTWPLILLATLMAFWTW